jgi:hypothetical protein
VAADGFHDPGPLETRAIEHVQGGADAEPQHAREVLRLVSGERDAIPVGRQVGRMKARKHEGL